MSSDSSASAGVGVLMNGWFSEINSQWPGQAMSLEIEETLLDTKSEYQHVQVFKSKTFGNVLVLDGVIQLTERDEMAYQEMISHLPLFAHSNPENVLIVGGGDGGVIREVVKHSCVKHITICEIDKVVIEAGKKYFPSVASAWDDSRVVLECGDAAKFLEKPEVEGKFDVIISDTSDPVGPAQALFESPFYRAMHRALRAGGKICTQAESIWMHLPLIEKLVKEASQIYANVEYASTQIPTYPCGQIGLLCCSKAGKERNPSFQKPRAIPKGEDEKYKFYNTALHTASFVLPSFVQTVVDKAAEEGSELRKEEEKKQKAAAKEAKKAKTPASAKGRGRGKRSKADEEEAAEEEPKKEEGEDEEAASKKAKTDSE